MESINNEPQTLKVQKKSLIQYEYPRQADIGGSSSHFKQDAKLMCPTGSSAMSSCPEVPSEANQSSYRR